MVATGVKQPLRDVDVCSDGAFSSYFLVQEAQATENRACYILGNWHTLASYLSPEVIWSSTNPGWIGPLRISYSALQGQLFATLFGTSPRQEYPLNPFHHLDDMNGSICMILAYMVSLFLEALRIYSVISLFKKEALIEFAVGTTKEGKPIAELLFDGRGQIIHTLVNVLVNDRMWNASFAPALFGLLQWFYVLNEYLHDRIPLLRTFALKQGRIESYFERSIPSKCDLWRDLIYEGNMSALQTHPARWQISTLGRLLHCLGSEFWQKIATSMATRHNLPVQLLQGPSQTIENDGSSVETSPVELCAAAAWRRQEATSPVESFQQSDGVAVKVVAAAISIGPRLSTGKVLEFLIFVEPPTLEHQQALFCGPHIATLPEAALREWSCSLNTSDTEGLQVQAGVTSFFKQAILVSCPLPYKMNFPSETDVFLTADPAGGSAKWEVSVTVCLKNSQRKLRDRTWKVAMCLPPAYNMQGLERSAPQLIEQHLLYHQMLGFESFSLYDLDGSFASHPEVNRLIEKERMRYYPRWALMISELAVAQCDFPTRGLTGSKANALVELTLTHCVWENRGEADFVLLGALDTFLAVGTSISRPAETCWGTNESRFETCCNGAHGQRGALSDPFCFYGNRSFRACCRDYFPSKQRARSITHLIDSVPPTILSNLGALSLGLCEFAAPHPSNGSLFQHLWRTPTCDSQYHHLVNPNLMVTQNMEWLRLRRNAGTFFVPVRWARLLHLVNTHSGKLRCHRLGNSYVSGRAPCTFPDHDMRWAFQHVREQGFRSYLQR